MRRLRLPAAALVVLLATAATATAAPATGDRPAGTVATWSHELNQNEHPRWNPRRAPVIAPRRWYRIVDGILDESGRAGLWFSGVSALPFPPLPLHPREPDGWRTPARFARAFRQTGLRWDVNVEVWAARRALDRGGAVVADPTTEAHTRRLSLLDPAYRRSALREIRRIVPRLRGAPYVNFYTGSDEPVTVLPRGRARSTPFGRRLARDFRRATGLALPDPTSRPSRGVREGLRWLAWSRWSGARFLAMKREQAALIRRLDPGAVVSPNDYGFIDGFIPWDYTRLAGFADVVEADPYVSYAERDRSGRGRYNPGFAAKLLHDLTGKRVRIVVQAFPYSRYAPQPGDLWAWSAQALRAGATDLSFFASDNPRFTAPRRYAAMLDVARAVRGARLPAPPADPEHLVLYATAAEGQAQPHRTGGVRYRTSGDQLYTTYALLGELAGGAFSFEADTRLAREPARLAAARTVWLPRADTLDAGVAARLAAWVRAGGTLVVTDPDAFTRTPRGASLRAVRDQLIGAPLGGARRGSILEVAPGALGGGAPDDLLSIPLDGAPRRAFAAVPGGAAVLARYLDGAPAAIVRPVGAGRVVAFAAEPMEPGVLDEPGDLARLVGDLHRWAGGTTGHPAWSYRLPGDPSPRRPPWETAVAPEDARAGM
ncbi:beta-galactosidase [Miltoncostaea marina]|uniref:beta-galactosidase n=1 Tax=Miltoncostaea marina TaxID=2843215 RepID=UPI001C3C31CA|nr:beta-galactosidase [Miltoncostaea marina]